MKKLFAALLLLSALLSVACAQNMFELTGQVHTDLPELTVRVADTGERMPEQLRENVLQVTVTTADGGLLQEFTYLSNETPAFEVAAAMAMLRDINFDGYQDLMLLTAMGARNVFHTFAVWDVEQGLFRPVGQTCEWLREDSRYAEEMTQAELCNYELYPEQRMVFSDEQDGYRFAREVWYMWDGSYTLTPYFIRDVYDAGEGLIGEAMTAFSTRITFLWDEAYPEEWYYGQEGVSAERRQAAQAIALHSATSRGETRRVANTDWVNLRKQDSKASASLAKINAGETVTVLVDGCGDENGWVRVLYSPENITMEELDAGRYTLTGYIWHSLLEAVP